MMRRITQAKPNEIEADYVQRVKPGLEYCQRVGNIMGATLYLSLAGTIDKGTFDSPKRIGCFSYGSGCCSEFYSGVVMPQSQEYLRRFEIERNLNDRYQLSMDEYESLLKGSGAVRFGTRNTKLDFQLVPGVIDSGKGRQRLYLEEIYEFHRKYRWES